MNTKRFLALAATALVAAPAPAAHAHGGSHSCKPIDNPYAGSRYEGTDLRKIRATNVECRSARPLVRGAHRKALGMGPTPSGVRTFSYKGWRVTGDLRGDNDRYVAKRGSKKITWIF